MPGIGGNPSTVMRGQAVQACLRKDEIPNRTRRREVYTMKVGLGLNAADKCYYGANAWVKDPRLFSCGGAGFVSHGMFLIPKINRGKVIDG